MVLTGLIRILVDPRRSKPTNKPMEIISPQNLNDSLIEDGRVRIFLGGSIDNGKAPNWQANISKILKNQNQNIYILNPRRINWDPGATKETIRDQIWWELSAQSCSDIRFYYLDKDSQSPETLLEIGFYGRQLGNIVYCPKEYFRYDNVSMTCKWFSVPCFDNLEDAVSELKRLIGARLKKND